MSGLPPNERIPGVYQQHRLQRQAGGLQVESRVLLIGARLSPASDARDHEAVRIRSRSESQVAFGAGSQLDLMVRAALATGDMARRDVRRGGMPELYAMAVPPIAGAGTVASTQTVKFGGKATGQGTAIAYVNDHVIAFGVLRGDDGAAVANGLQHAVEAHTADLGYTVESASNVVTFTAREPGEWGEELYIDIDLSAVNGVSAILARGAVGAGTLDMTRALAESLADDYSCVVLPESDHATRGLVKKHITDAWDYTNKRYRIVVMGSTGDLATAHTAAAELDDWRVVLASAEKIADKSTPWDRKNSARCHGFELAASCGTRLYTQVKANYNFNKARIPVHGRPRNVNRQNVNDAINAGVTVVLTDEYGQTPGVILDFISTAITDQAGGTAPDTRWQPIEVAKVVQVISRSMQAELATLPQAEADDDTLALARAAALAVLETAAGERLIQAPAKDSVAGDYQLAGGAMQLVLEVNYTVIVGLDLVAVTHNITR